MELVMNESTDQNVPFMQPTPTPASIQHRHSYPYNTPPSVPTALDSSPSLYERHNSLTIASTSTPPTFDPPSTFLPSYYPESRNNNLLPSYIQENQSQQPYTQSHRPSIGTDSRETTNYPQFSQSLPSPSTHRHLLDGVSLASLPTAPKPTGIPTYDLEPTDLSSVLPLPNTMDYNRSRQRSYWNDGDDIRMYDRDEPRQERQERPIYRSSNSDPHYFAYPSHHSEHPGRPGSPYYNRRSPAGYDSGPRETSPIKADSMAMPFKGSHVLPPLDSDIAMRPSYSSDPIRSASYTSTSYIMEQREQRSDTSPPKGKESDLEPEDYTQVLQLYQHILDALPHIRSNRRPTDLKGQSFDTLLNLSISASDLLSGKARDPSSQSQTQTSNDIPERNPPGRSGPTILGAPTTNSVLGKRSNASLVADKKSPKCLGCGATETPEWRRGPLGPRTLCNACGLVHMKMMRKQRKLEEFEAIEAMRRADEASRGN